MTIQTATELAPSWTLEVDPTTVVEGHVAAFVIDYVWGRTDGSPTEAKDYYLPTGTRALRDVPASFNRLECPEGMMLDTIGAAMGALEVAIRRLHESRGIETRHFFIEDVNEVNGIAYVRYGT